MEKSNRSAEQRIGSEIVKLAVMLDKQPRLAVNKDAERNIGKGFCKLLNDMIVECTMDHLEENAVSTALQEIGTMLDKGRIGTYAAGVVLEQLASAINEVSPNYLSPTPQGKFSGNFNGNVGYGLDGKLIGDPWEVMAVGLARKVVDRVNEEFVYGGDLSYSASLKAWETCLKALPFLTLAESSEFFDATAGPIRGSLMDAKKRLLRT
jgi:hypothetical protein